MGIDALRRAPIGRLVPITGTDGRAGQHYEYLAYLADPLPESVELSSETWTLVAGAEAALARLDQVARQVPSPELLRGPAIRREAQSMSALEGTLPPLKQCSNPTLRTAPISPLPSSRFLNYVEAAEHAFKWVEDRPLTSNLFGELQRTLVRGTAGEHRDAGGFRERQVFIGPQDAPIRDPRCLPAPPGDQLRIAFDA